MPPEFFLIVKYPVERQDLNSQTAAAIGHRFKRSKLTPKFGVQRDFRKECRNLSKHIYSDEALEQVTLNVLDLSEAIHQIQNQNMLHAEFLLCHPP